MNIQSEMFVYVGKFLLKEGLPCHKNSTETAYSVVLTLSRVYNYCIEAIASELH